MAAILRSSVIQTARRAFTGEGTLSVRALHTRSRKVDRFRKTNDVARKELEVGFTERLVQELNSSYPSLLGNAKQHLLSISAVCASMLGYQVGFAQSLDENCQACSGKQARRP